MNLYSLNTIVHFFYHDFFYLLKTAERNSTSFVEVETRSGVNMDIAFVQLMVITRLIIVITYANNYFEPEDYA